MNLRTLPFPILTTLLLLLLLPSPIRSSPTNPDAERVSELLSLQSQSPSGVIRLTDQTLARFLTSHPSPSRSYSLLIFFDALQLHDKPELHLQSLRSQFSLLSKSFLSNNLRTPSQSKLFFCDIEFKHSQSSFALFGVNSLPHVRLVSPHVLNPQDSDAIDQADFSRLLDSMPDFIESRTGLSVGPIHRPPVLSRTQLSCVVAVVLVAAPFLVKRVLDGNTLLHNPLLWMAMSVFVYFFSVSGAMHNIIRKMPMFMADRNDPSRLVFFYQGSGMQLGAEGFAVGFLYTIVGLLLAFATNVLVRVRNVAVQRGFMFAALLVSFWAVNKVIYLDNWKTGYGIHGFWPSAWN
ncbi:hypothetical protein Scep_013046 [Stephania cephalantha]|uniref:Dolichyl-diphosphooligosaccharide--protein glycosyltransferase subunit 3B n=1 Tax=Stephania cephalantha TaxID=152367 RepID=A0AAP0JI42_9MAGN